MKKILCFSMVFILAALLVVPCFAAETTVDRGDPVDWFGGETTGVIYYEYSATSGSMVDVQLPFRDSNVATVADPFTVGTWDFAIGDTISVSVASGGYTHLWKNDTDLGTISNNSSLYPFTIKVSESSFVIRGGSTKDGTPVEGIVGTQGFVDSGFSYALSELSTIVSAILSNQYILIAIGLAVAVPLVAWGISKIKSLVKGY